jgi:hypothetical protein
MKWLDKQEIRYHWAMESRNRKIIYQQQKQKFLYKGKVIVRLRSKLFAGEKKELKTIHQSMGIRLG